MAKIDKILKARGKAYGNFYDHAVISQNIKRALWKSPQYELLDDDMKEAMEMVAHKFGRIINGDKYFQDSWDDSIGYISLVAKRIEKGELE